MLLVIVVDGWDGGGKIFWGEGFRRNVGPVSPYWVSAGYGHMTV